MAGVKDRTEGLLALVCETALESASDIFNSVEGVDITSIQDRSTCYVRDGDVEYRWYEDSLAAPAPPTVLLPEQLTVGDRGRWILISSGGGGAVDSVTGTDGVTVSPTTGNVVVSGIDLYARDGSNGAMTANVNMGGFSITNAVNGTFSGAVTAATFNGVALTTVGFPNFVLNQQGNYVDIASIAPVTAVTGAGNISVAPTTGNVVVDGTALYARDGTNGAMTANVNMGGNSLTNAVNGTFSGAVTAATFNGVALTTLGSATSVLNEQGNYVAISSIAPVTSVSGINGISVAPTTGAVVVDGAALYARDGSNGAMTANVNMGGFSITNAVNGTFSGAVTAATFNGVALTTLGSATNFLNAQGNYVAVGGGGGSLIGVTVTGTAAVGLVADPGAGNMQTYILTNVGARSIQLPGAGTTDGTRIVVKEGAGTGGSGAEITITVAGGLNIDFAATFTMQTIAQSATFQWDNTSGQWWVI